MIKSLPVNAGDVRDEGSDLTQGSGRSHGVGNGNWLQYKNTGKFHGQRRLMGCSLSGHKESDTTEQHPKNYLLASKAGPVPCFGRYK